MSETEVTIRDSRGRDTRIHGLVLDTGNPAPTLRELLRQWVAYYESDRSRGADLAARSRMVLEDIGPDGEADR